MASPVQIVALPNMKVTQLLYEKQESAVKLK
jgi:hypothetical protein